MYLHSPSTEREIMTLGRFGALIDHRELGVLLYFYCKCMGFTECFVKLRMIANYMNKSIVNKRN